MSSIFAPMKIDEIGTGRAERRVTINGKPRVRGDELSHADLASMATANRNAMIENRIITVFPKFVQVRGGLGGAEPTSAAIEGDFHVVAKGFGLYDVIKGTVLLKEATKEAAAEFVAAEQARAAEPAQPGAAGPGNARLAGTKRGKKSARKRSRNRRSPVAGPATPPAPSGSQDNGPVE